jgi:hypothetical protein
VEITSGAKMRFPNACMLLAERLNGCSIQRHLQPILSNRIRASPVRAYHQQLRINVIAYFPDAVCDFLTFIWTANECLCCYLRSGRLRDMCGALKYIRCPIKKSNHVKPTHLSSMR